MPEATIVDLSTRRTIRGPALRTTRRATSPPGIVQLCAAFDALERDKRGLFDTIPDEDQREHAISEIEAQQEPLAFRLAEMRASNLPEHQARARTLSRYFGEAELETFARSLLWHERLIAAILRDLDAEPAPADDADLLRLCREAMRLDAIAEAADMDESDRLQAEWNAVHATIVRTRARTADGIRAKAAIIRHLMAPMQPRWARGDTYDRLEHDPLVWSLVNDLASVPARPVREC